MSIFNLFSDEVKRVAAPSLDSAMDRAVTDAVLNGDDVFLQTQKIGADILLKNGETVATLALKTQAKLYEQYAKICRDFQEDDEGFHDRVETIAALGVGMLPKEYYATACVRLSSLGLLQRLNIPSDKWPNALIDDNFFAPWNTHYKVLDEAYKRSQLGEALLAHIEPKADRPNEWHESPAMLRNDCNKAWGRSNIYINRTNSALTHATHFSKILAEPIDAKQFIDYARDEKLRQIFDWLTIYKPNEQAFLEAFDPNWRAHQANAAPGSDVRKQQILYLHSMGYYAWLTKYRTIDVEKTIALDKLAKRDASGSKA